MSLREAAAQVWPPFVLVTGLLLIGLIAHRDGLFELAGQTLHRLPGPTSVMFGTCLLLVAVVTAVLNLDTAVVFLTPVLLHAARGRGVDEEPFLYASVYIANASSLYLPGSNLTNLLVLAHQPISGATFAAEMLAVALAATLATAVGLLLLFRRQLPAGTRRGKVRARGHAVGLGLPATAAAAGFTVWLRNPAIPVLAVGVACTTIELLRGRLRWRQVTHAVGPLVLAGLFLTSVALGTLARSWDGPAQLLAGAGRWGTTAIGALTAITINNLPAAVLLSARPLTHPRALLIGLNIGPNLAATGSLSALLWLRAARQAGAQPSLRTFSLRGVPLAVLAMTVALGAATILSTPQ